MFDPNAIISIISLLGGRGIALMDCNTFFSRGSGGDFLGCRGKRVIGLGIKSELEIEFTTRETRFGGGGGGVASRGGVRGSKENLGRRGTGGSSESLTTRSIFVK